ncbi:RNase A-like domain-containing protein [Streptomyces sp. NPDC057325]|uniref:RNase A-like domain-containing protein n=1 Tax=unclassified Streptomyces TaxID=2593676 RepID=UPI003629FBC1
MLTGAASVLVHNCGDLNKDEGVQGAHPKEHLDLSDNYIVNRASTDPNTNVASTLPSSSAQANINSVVSHNRVAINKWAARAQVGERRNFKLEFNSPVGRVANSSGEVRDATTLTLVLMRVANGYQGHKGAWVLFTMKAS